MVGSGALAFAVWSYVLGKMKPDFKTEKFYVEVNPKLLGAILGEEPEAVVEVLERFCGPDECSRTKECDGRRLVREGQFLYWVVNGGKYNEIRSQAERRKYQQVKQAEYRAQRKRGEVNGDRVRRKKALVGLTATERLLERAETPEEVARVEELADGVPAGYHGSSGPEAQEVVRRNMLRGPAPEDDTPDPDAV